jgi:hypothetical protein
MSNHNIVYLSICIPANGRYEYVRNTLKSIYSTSNIAQVNQNDFEVILADNDPKASLKVLCEEFKFHNFHYFNTNCEGFMNSYHSLTFGRAEFLKLHNSQELFNPGALPLLINFIKSNLKSKPLCFFTSALLKTGKVYEYSSFDEFMYRLSYFCTWSNGFSIWREDFNSIESIPLNNIFPQTSLLLTQYFKNKYIVNDQNLFHTQFVPKRSGYNKFQAFSVQVPDLVDDLLHKKIISLRTKNKIYKDILFEFLPLLYFNVNITKRELFSSEHMKDNIRLKFPKYSFYLVVLLSFFIPFKIIWRKLKISFFIKSRF